MTETIRVPDPVAERIDRQANREDIPKGAVVRDWMEAADRLEQLESGR